MVRVRHVSNSIKSCKLIPVDPLTHNSIFAVLFSEIRVEVLGSTFDLNLSTCV